MPKLPSSEPPAKWTLYGLPIQKGLALGIGAPLYLPSYGSPVWFDPRLFAQDEDEWQAIEYRMPTEPVEVVGLVRDLGDIPPVLAPYVRVVGWIVERAPSPPLPPVPILLVPKLPPLLPPETTVVLDANAGVAYIEPNAAVLARYQSQLLRIATHTRYHLESEHLPVATWDGRRIQVGCCAADWDDVSRAVREGAELVWLHAHALPTNAATTAHALGGKPLWLHDPLALTREDAHWQRLLRFSAELNLTLFVDRVDALQEVRDSLEVAREALRTEHAPTGTLEVGLLILIGASDATVPSPPTPLPRRGRGESGSPLSHAVGAGGQGGEGNTVSELPIGMTAEAHGQDARATGSGLDSRVQAPHGQDSPRHAHGQDARATGGGRRIVQQLEQQLLAGAIAAPPYALCWHIPKLTKQAAAALWTQQRVARRLGVRRAFILPDSRPDTLAVALGLEPHTLIVPAGRLAQAKARLARLGVGECREWLVQRLRRWRDPALHAQLDEWLAQRG